MGLLSPASIVTRALVLLVLWATIPQVPALEPPFPGQVEQYLRDGTLAARVSEAQRFGNHLPRSALTRRTLARLEAAATGELKPAAPLPAWRGLPTTGTNRVLVLLVDWPDMPSHTSASVIEMKLFGEGRSSEYPVESLKQFYLRSSYGQLVLEGTVLGWHRMTHERSWYTNTFGSGPAAITEICREAAAAYDEAVDFAQFDGNGDGEVDYLLVVWAGPPGEWASFWWGHQSALPTDNLKLDGVAFGEYAWLWEAAAPTDEFTVDAAIHETGHALGLPDLYDYSPEVGPPGGVGGMDMMDGRWGDHNAFSKFMLDWINPVVVRSNQTAALRASALQPDALILMPGYAGGAAYAEYFLVQNRLRMGNDIQLPGNGLMIWHVDATPDDAGTGFRYDNSFTAHKLLRLIEGDGEEAIESGGRGDAADYWNAGEVFGPEGTINSQAYDWSWTGVRVGDISVAGETVTAEVGYESPGPSREVIANFPLDSDPGWIREGPWAFGQPLGQGGDPGGGFTGTNAFAFNLAGAYVPCEVPYYLTTTPLDCSRHERVAVAFWRWLGIDDGAYDHATVEVSTDGVNWHTVWAHVGSGYQDRRWQRMWLDLSPWADRQPQVYVRWSLGPTDGTIVGSGWNLDDIQLWGAPAAELSVGFDGELASSGFEGGPFAPTTHSCVIGNPRTHALDWLAIASEDWLEVDPANGSIPAGQRQEVSLRLGASANQLPEGIYTNTILIRDAGNGFEVSVPVKLVVKGQPGRLEILDSIAPDRDLNLQLGETLMGHPLRGLVVLTNADPVHRLQIQSLGFHRYEESFDGSEAAGWQPSDSARWTVSGGEYAASGLPVGVYLQSMYGGAKWRDLAVRTAIRRTGVLGNTAMVAVRASDDFEWGDTSRGSAYAVGISGNRMYWVVRFHDGEESWLTGGWIPEAALHGGETSEEVLVSVREDQIALYLNGALVYSGRDGKPATPGRIVLGGYESTAGQTHFYFDNLRQTEPIHGGAAASEFPPSPGWARSGPFRLEGVPALPFVLGPGQALPLEVVFDPVGSGTASESLLVGTDEAPDTLVRVAIEAVAWGDALVVTPDSAQTARARPNGSIAPASFEFQVRNVGEVPMEWTATEAHGWLAAIPAGGLLEPGGVTNVTLAWQPPASTLTVGDYPVSVLFSNLTAVSAQTRSLTLRIRPEPAPTVTPASLAVTLMAGWRTNVTILVGNAVGAEASLAFWSLTRETNRIVPSPAPPLRRAFAPAAQSLTGTPSPEGYREGELLVRFSPGIVPDRRAEVLREAGGARVLEEFTSVPGLVWLRLPPGRTVAESLEVFRRAPEVVYAHPNHAVSVTRVPGDPQFADQWNLLNTGQAGGKPGADIGAATAWERSQGAAEVVVAVIDSGLDYAHPDLAANLWTNPGEIPGNGIDDDGNGLIDDYHGYDFRNNDGDPADDHGHGTACAGIIGAVGDNGLGLAGINWRVRLMALKFIGPSGQGFTADSIRCVEYARRMGARVANNSWTGGAYDQALKEVIDAAGVGGLVFVSAAGNDATDNDVYPQFPSNFDSPSLISVMATDHRDLPAWFSCFGAFSVHLGAPGDDVPTTARGGGYQRFSGTSAAAPHVAGACAMLLSLNPTLSAEQVKRTLLETVDPVLPGLCSSGGRLNLGAAVARVGAAWLRLLPAQAGDIAPGQAREVVTEFSAEGLAPGRYEGEVVIYDNATGSSPTVIPVSLTVEPRRYPPVLAVVPDQAMPEDGGVLELALEADDPDTPPERLVVSAVSSNQELLPNDHISLQGTNSVWYLRLSPLSDRNGATTLSVSVTDGEFVATRQFLLQVQAVNDPPSWLTNDLVLTVDSVAGPPGMLAMAEDQAARIDGLGLMDVDAGDGPLRAEVRVGQGALSLGDTNGLTLIEGSSMGDRWLLEGGLSALNSALSNLVYLPTTDFFGLDSLELLADDLGNTGEGGSAQTLLSLPIEVRPMNDAPVPDAIHDVETPELTPLELTLRVQDPEMATQTFTFALESGAPEGMTVSPEGVVRWTPGEAQGPGTNEVTVRVTDSGDPPLSATLSFRVIVREVNTPPWWGPGGDLVVDEETPLELALTARDQDLPAQRLAYGLEPGAPEGMSLSLEGVVRWIPAEGQGPSTNVVGVWVTDDGEPPMQATNWITVIVREVNTAPVLTELPEQVVDEGATLVVRWEAQDADVPVQKLGYALEPGAPPGVFISGDGTMVWTTGEAQGPSTNEVTVRVTDDGEPPLSDRRTVRVIVREVNTAPALEPLADQALDEETPLELVLRASDRDLPPQRLSYGLEPGAPEGMTVSAEGVLRWVPTEVQGPSTNRVGLWVADDGEPALAVTNWLTVVVREVNRAPGLTELADPVVDEGALLLVRWEAQDADVPVQKLGYALEPGAPSGMFISGNGTIVWTPGEVRGPGTNEVTVRVTDDGEPPLSDRRTIRVIVREVNAAPVLEAVADQELDEETLLELALTASDRDLPAQRLSYGLAAGAPEGMAVSPEGVIQWTPSEEQGPGTNQVGVWVVDDGEPALAVTNWFTVVVREVNTSPVVAGVGEFTVEEGQAFAVAMEVSDRDVPVQAFAYALEPGAPEGMTISPAGLVQWTPTETQGPSTNEITVRVTDDGEPPLSATRTFQIVVREVNTAPVLAELADQVVDEATRLLVRWGSQDGDAPAQRLTYVLESGAPSGMFISGDGTLVWTPSETQGPSTNEVTVRVTDDGEPRMSDRRTVRVIVREVNTAPVLAELPEQVVDEGATLVVRWEAQDADVPVQKLGYVLEPGAPPGVFVSGDGTMVWTTGEVQGPSTNEVTVRVTDDGEPPLSDRRTVRVIVREVNTAPALEPLTDQELGEETPLELVLRASDRDVPAQRLSYGLEPGAPEGMTVSAEGVLRWVPTEVQGPSTNRVGVWVADDGELALAVTNWLTVVVREVNRAPGLTELADPVVDEGALLLVRWEAQDADVPVQKLGYALEPGAPSGMFISGNGTIVWTPGEVRGPGTNEVTVRVTDNGEPPLSDRRTIRVIVREVNRPPVWLPIPDREAAVGTALQFDLVATDPDLPAQILAYGLASGAPDGVEVTPGGLFVWTPRAAQAGTTNVIRVYVRDGGELPLQAELAFTITVAGGPLRIQNAGLTEQGNPTLEWASFAGSRYAVETTTALEAGSWQWVETVEAVDRVTRWVDRTTALETQRFYRVRLLE